VGNKPSTRRTGVGSVKSEREFLNATQLRFGWHGGVVAGGKLSARRSMMMA
jgi:hypothetical protein